MEMVPGAPGPAQTMGVGALLRAVKDVRRFSLEIMLHFC